MVFIKDEFYDIFKWNNNNNNNNNNNYTILLNNKIKPNDFRFKIKLSHYNFITLDKSNKYFDYTNILPDKSFINNKLISVKIENSYNFTTCILPSNIKNIYSESKLLTNLSNTKVEKIYTNTHINLFPSTLKTYIIDIIEQIEPNFLSNLPVGLESLYIRNNIRNNITNTNINLTNLPISLVNFGIHILSEYLPNLSNLPLGIKNICIVGKNIVDDLSNLPNSVKNLFINLIGCDNNIDKSLSNLPNSIEILDLDFTLFTKKSLYLLYPNLKVLRLRLKFQCIKNVNEFNDEFNDEFDGDFLKKLPKNIEELYLCDSVGMNINVIDYINNLENLKILKLPEEYNIEIPLNIKNFKSLKKLIIPDNIIFDDNNYLLSNIKIEKYENKSIYHKYLIEQLQFVSSENIQLNFNHPVKNLLW